VSFWAFPPVSPRKVTTGEVGHSGEAQVTQRGSGQARGIPFGARNDDRLTVPVDIGEGVVTLEIEPPLEHVALNHDRVVELALLGSLAFGANVDQERSGDAPRSEFLGAHTVDVAARIRQQLVNGRSLHGATDLNADWLRAETHLFSRGIK
jgi:hypothetical protein